MKTKTPHHVLTDAEAKTPLRRLAHAVITLNPVSLVLAYAAGVAAFFALGTQRPLAVVIAAAIAAIAAVVVYAVCYAFSLVAGFDPDSPFEPLSTAQLGELKAIAENVPEARDWVAEALRDGRTFRRRDLSAARAVHVDLKLQKEHDSALYELRRTAGVTSSPTADESRTARIEE